MGWLARVFSSSDAARIERAQRFLEKERYNDVRLELDGVEGPTASEMRDQALIVLVQWNLEESRARLTAGDAEGAQEHMALAKEFGATPNDLQGVRRLAREIRLEEKEAAKKAAEEASHVEPVGDDPIWRLPPDHPRLRYAVLVESYPEALRQRLVDLGEEFAAAVMQLEEGQPRVAFDGISPFVSTDPVARFERARAALAGGQLPPAASDLHTFGAEVGHQRIGTTHTAAMLAGVLSRMGRAGEALVMLETELEKGADLELSANRASLLEVLGRLEEAESVTAKLLKSASRQMGLYRQLARIREKRGDRVAAAETLEWGLNTCCSAPGKCGNQPLDVAAVRTLARLYLEDRARPERVGELMDKLARHVEDPGWEDRYVAALHARNDGNPQAPAMAQRLLDGLGAADPRRALVGAAFEGSSRSLVDGNAALIEA
ncbi:MAG: tetratricopeptide (TPR) repeat protein [Myxococcota bacterium]|jgi:tetratricopeptide (TPR) repeat protein